MIILVLLTLKRFHEQIVHYKLLRFVNVRMIDLCVDVEKTAHCARLSMCAVHQLHAYVFDSAPSLYCIESLCMSKMLLLSAPLQSY
jgi:hypothetical protein